MDNLTTIIVAIIGSAGISALATWIMGRFAFDRDVQKFSALEGESKIIESLIGSIEKESNSEVKSGKAVLKHIISARHYKKMIESIIPNSRTYNVAMGIFVFLTISIGILFMAEDLWQFTSGESSSGDAAGSENAQLSDSGSSYRALWIICYVSAAMMLFSMIIEGRARSRLRADLYDAINGEFAEGFRDGGNLKQRRFHRFILPPDIRSNHARLMSNLRDSLTTKNSAVPAANGTSPEEVH